MDGRNPLRTAKEAREKDDFPEKADKSGFFFTVSEVVGHGFRPSTVFTREPSVQDVGTVVRNAFRPSAA